MSNYPPQPPQYQQPYPQQPYPQQPYAPPGMPGYPMPYGGYAPPVNARPGSVTTLAVIGIIIGSLALLVKGLNILLHLTTNATAKTGTPDLIDSIAAVILSPILLIAAIGCLKLNDGSRKLMIGWSIAYMVLLAFRAVTAITVTVPRLIELQSQTGNLPPGYEGGAYVGAIGVILILMVYPICNLAFFNKPHVVAAFKAAAPPLSPMPPY